MSVGVSRGKPSSPNERLYPRQGAKGSLRVMSVASEASNKQPSCKKTIRSIRPSGFRSARTVIELVQATLPTSDRLSRGQIRAYPRPSLPKTEKAPWPILDRSVPWKEPSAHGPG